jgi:hypothetical protein
MELQFANCPECGGPATLLEVTEELEDVPDLSGPGEKARMLVKVEEFRCQDPACEHEFERIIREAHP